MHTLSRPLLQKIQNKKTPPERRGWFGQYPADVWVWRNAPLIRSLFPVQGGISPVTPVVPGHAFFVCRLCYATQDEPSTHSGGLEPPRQS